jgi:hypothetical protein
MVKLLSKINQCTKMLILRTIFISVGCHASKQCDYLSLVDRTKFTVINSHFDSVYFNYTVAQSDFFA